MLKILVVDDDESIRALLEKSLAIDYSVSSSDSIEEAKRLLSDNSIDLLFLDVWLNGEESIPLLYWIRGRRLTCKVILITGDVDYKKKFQKTLHRVADSILIKPFDIKDIILVAHRALEKKVEDLHGDNKSKKEV